METVTIQLTREELYYLVHILHTDLALAPAWAEVAATVSKKFAAAQRG